jgi:hypothetical protein
VGRVLELLREKQLDQAESLLKDLIQVVEIEAAETGYGVAPWYYDQLAKTYHKAGRYGEEVRVLERFANQRHAAGEMPRKLIARLEKAKQALGGGTDLQRSRESAEDTIAGLFSDWKRRSGNDEE